MRRLTAALILAVTLTAATACTPAQVTAFFHARGQTIDHADASFVAIALDRWADQQRALLAYLAAVDAQIPNEARWDRVAQCESGGNWSINTGNGYYGGLQFLPSTWRAVGGTGLPHQHSKAEQIRRAEILKARAGLGQWPVCGRLW